MVILTKFTKLEALHLNFKNKLHLIVISASMLLVNQPTEGGDYGDRENTVYTARWQHTWGMHKLRIAISGQGNTLV